MYLQNAHTLETNWGIDRRTRRQGQEKVVLLLPSGFPISKAQWKIPLGVVNSLDSALKTEIYIYIDLIKTKVLSKIPY